MPKKGKKGSRSTAQQPPSSDLPADAGVIDPFADDDGFDIADDLLVALDEKDAHEAAKKQAASASTAQTDSTHTGGLRGAGERLINGLRHHNHDNEHPAPADADSAATLSTSSNSGRRSSIRKLFGSSPKGPEPSPSETIPTKKPSRQQQRKDRKAAEVAEIRRQAEEEVKAGANKPDEAAIERQGISAMCSALGVSMHEITPDGHCLYAAVADQLNLRAKTTTDYKAARRATAHEMRTHPDEYKPFISDSDEHMAGIINKEAGTLNSEQAQEKYFLDYCSAVENTGVWGGQPEILALSRAFKTQINVVQAGVPVLKVGEGEYDGEPLYISYHRKMYGLGEHYNSLRPASAA